MVCRRSREAMLCHERQGHRMTLPESAASWVTAAAGSGCRIVAARRLPLGGWHVNHAVDVVDSHGVMHRLVLRRWARPGWDADDPDYTADREARVLAMLGPTAVPAPEVVAADLDGGECGVPALLLTRLVGDPPRQVEDHDAFGTQLAEALVSIHDVDRGETRLEPYRLYYDRASAAPPQWMSEISIWRRAASAVRRLPPEGEAGLIHRDYHPENTLWADGRLTGVVDWTQASCGPPGLDVGHMRWNLVLDYGQQVADRFLDVYRAAGGRALDHQSYWDLVTLLDLLFAGGDDPGDLRHRDLQLLASYANTLLATLD